MRLYLYTDELMWLVNLDKKMRQIISKHTSTSVKWTDTYIQTDRLVRIQKDKQIDKQTDRQIKQHEKHTGRQTDS